MDNHHFEPNFQTSADYWAQNQFRRFRKHLSIAYIKGMRFQKHVAERDWQGDWAQVEQFYFANLALFNGASRDLPYKTLTLLGRYLRHPEKKEHVQKMIQENIFKFNGHFYKLDDPSLQGEFRRRLKSGEFDSLENYQQAA